MGRHKITKQELDKLLICDPVSGILRWKCRMASTVPAGSIAGTTHTVSTDGYVYVVIAGKRFPAHHLVWLHVYGELPSSEVDHIDRNKRNNAINNLRVPDKATQISNTSKVNLNGQYLPGICWDPKNKKFRVFHKRQFYGYHSNLLDAAASKFRSIRADSYAPVQTAYK